MSYPPPPARESSDFEQLPEELIAEIFEFTRGFEDIDISSIAALCGVSRLFYVIGTPYLYRKLCIETSEEHRRHTLRPALLLRTLIRKPQLGRCIRELSLTYARVQADGHLEATVSSPSTGTVSNLGISLNELRLCLAEIDYSWLRHTLESHFLVFEPMATMLLILWKATRITTLFFCFNEPYNFELRTESEVHDEPKAQDWHYTAVALLMQYGSNMGIPRFNSLVHLGVGNPHGRLGLSAGYPNVGVDLERLPALKTLSFSDLFNIPSPLNPGRRVSATLRALKFTHGNYPMQDVMCWLRGCESLCEIEIDWRDRPADEPWRNVTDLGQGLTNLLCRHQSTLERLVLTAMEADEFKLSWIPPLTDMDNFTKLSRLEVEAQFLGLTTIRLGHNIFAPHIKLPPNLKSLEIHSQLDFDLIPEMFAEVARLDLGILEFIRVTWLLEEDEFMPGEITAGVTTGNCGMALGIRRYGVDDHFVMETEVPPTTSLLKAVALDLEHNGIHGVLERNFQPRTDDRGDDPLAAAVKFIDALAAGFDPDAAGGAMNVQTEVPVASTGPEFDETTASTGTVTEYADEPIAMAGPENTEVLVTSSAVANPAEDTDVLMTDTSDYGSTMDEGAGGADPDTQMSEDKDEPKDEGKDEAKAAEYYEGKRMVWSTFDYGMAWQAAHEQK